MKTLTVYCDKDLVFRWNEWPENNCVLLPREFFEKETEYKLHVIGYNDCELAYKAALEVAKRESIPMDKQDDIKTRAIEKYWTPNNNFILKPDTFYSFPFEGEVKRLLHCDEYHSHTKSSCYLARLIPESKEESQDCWKQIYIDFKDGEGWINFSKRMNKIFSITRKQP
jgi:hypothetical protein